MKNEILDFGGRVLILVVMLSLFVLPGCGNASPEIAQAQDALALLQQNGYFTARLYGLMTYAISGTAFTSLTDLSISSIPIEWMGQVFNGRIAASGPGSDITDQVHGGVSPDGAWLLSLSFSRQVIRQGENVISYRVEMKNVPIAKTAKGEVTEPGSFEKEGDIQKYVDLIEYTSGRLENGEIVDGSTYLSMDWTNSLQGRSPTLKLTFEKVPSRPMGGAAEKPSGMTGK